MLCCLLMDGTIDSWWGKESFFNRFTNEVVNHWDQVRQRCPQADKFHNDLLLRLMKHWNVNKNYRDMASFTLEDTIAQDLQFAYISCSSYTDYLKKAFRAIKYKTDSNRVQLAIDRIDNALEYESDGMPYSALQEIKIVFPEV